MEYSNPYTLAVSVRALFEFFSSWDLLKLVFHLPTENSMIIIFKGMTNIIYLIIKYIKKGPGIYLRFMCERVETCDCMYIRIFKKLWQE